MPRAASPTPTPAAKPRNRRRSAAGGTLLGVFIGLVLGLGLAAGVAYYLMKSNGPFPAQGGAREAREAAKESGKGAQVAAEKPRFDFYKILPGVEEPKVQAEAPKTGDRAVVGEAKDKAGEKAKAADKAAEKAADKDKAPDKVAKAPDKAPEPAAKAADKAEGTTAAKLPERFWLQAGSFSTESDAENLKARLAFAGWQANVQQGTLPDKGVRYRVRLGPYDNTDELNRIKNDLTRSGFDVAVIKF
ncbi:MAG: SPOR domain-containing protein [Burkholderiales bacterium]